MMKRILRIEKKNRKIMKTKFIIEKECKFENGEQDIKIGKIN